MRDFVHEPLRMCAEKRLLTHTCTHTSVYKPSNNQRTNAHIHTHTFTLTHPHSRTHTQRVYVFFSIAPKSILNNYAKYLNVVSTLGAVCDGVFGCDLRCRGAAKSIEEGAAQRRPNYPRYRHSIVQECATHTIFGFGLLFLGGGVGFDVWNALRFVICS